MKHWDSFKVVSVLQVFIASPTAYKEKTYPYDIGLKTTKFGQA